MALQTKVKKDSVNNMVVNELLQSSNTVFVVGNTYDWRLIHVSKNVKGTIMVFGM